MHVGGRIIVSRRVNVHGPDRAAQPVSAQGAVARRALIVAAAVAQAPQTAFLFAARLVRRRVVVRRGRRRHGR